MLSISEMILSYLLFSKGFTRKVIIHLKEEYFDDSAENIIFKIIKNHFVEYDQLPTKDEIVLELESSSGIAHSILDQAGELLGVIFKDCSDISSENMFIKAEEFAKNRSLFLAMSKAIEITKDDDDSSNLSKTAIPKIMSDALAVSFDTAIGHEYFSDYMNRFETYNRDEQRIPFDLETLNKMTGGGVTRNSLNIILGGTNVGKSLCLCHLAASYISQGYDVLYVTLEMSEDMTAQRIDANLLDIRMDGFKNMSSVEYEKKVFKAKERAQNGRLFIKYNPPLAVTSAHLDNLIEELKMKKDGFVPDIIIVDYMGILGSSTVSMKGSINTNSYFKFVSEELRSLANKHNSVCWTAQQFNRGGYGSSDPELDDAAESFGAMATADFIIGISQSDEMRELKQYYLKVLKTRYSSKDTMSSCNIGVETSLMKLIDLPHMSSNTHKREEFNNKIKSKSNAKKIDYS